LRCSILEHRCAAIEQRVTIELAATRHIGALQGALIRRQVFGRDAALCLVFL
jgi:hypothetical protein